MKIRDRMKARIFGPLPQFGRARLYRDDTGLLERVYYRLLGLADPAHYIRSRYFMRYTEGLNPKSVLDVGCGAGDYAFYLAERFPEASVKGIDGNASIIRRNIATSKKMDLRNLAFAVEDIRDVRECETYDLILCVESLQYLEDPSFVIRLLAKALKPRGSLFVHMPLTRFRPVPLHRFLRDFHEDEVVATRTKQDVNAMVVDAKLVVDRIQETFAYGAGELACSLFCLFYENHLSNRLLQGAIAPWTRMCAWAELHGRWSRGYALALLAHKGE